MLNGKENILTDLCEKKIDAFSFNGWYIGAGTAFIIIVFISCIVIIKLKSSPRFERARRESFELIPRPHPHPESPSPYDVIYSDLPPETIDSTRITESTDSDEVDMNAEYSEEMEDLLGQEMATNLFERDDENEIRILPPRERPLQPRPKH